MCELLVGLPEVNVLGVEDLAGQPLRVHIESRVDQARGRERGCRAAVKERPPVSFVDPTTRPSCPKDGLRGRRLGRVVTVVDRGFSSDANLTNLRRTRHERTSSVPQVNPTSGPSCHHELRNPG